MKEVGEVGEAEEKQVAGVEAKAKALAAARSPLHRQRALGFSVFPVKGKVPLVPWSEYQYRLPTLTELDGWAAQFPDAGMAIVCGKVSRLAVLDVDPRHGGDRSMCAYPPLARTVWTGGGGWHFYLRVNEPLPKISNLLPGVDLQGEGSYVISPPSIHHSGEPYKWVGKMLREVPEWLPGLVATRASSPVSPVEALSPLPPAVVPLSPASSSAASVLRVLLDTAMPGTGARYDYKQIHCPAHADNTPSLLIRILPTGAVVLRCFADCPREAILGALGAGYEHC